MFVDHLIAASLCGFAKLLTGVRALWLGSEPVARTRCTLPTTAATAISC
jgi:hypothetical protein